MSEVTEPADFSHRHPSTQEKMRWLVPNPNLPSGAPAAVSWAAYALGKELLTLAEDGPQFTIALQRLVDAKDAAVRQAIADAEAAEQQVIGG